jgi:hypothetical protein
LEDLDKRSEEMALMDKIYNAQQAITDSQFTLQGRMKTESSSPQIKDVTDHQSPGCSSQEGQ